MCFVPGEPGRAYSAGKLRSDARAQARRGAGARRTFTYVRKYAGAERCFCAARKISKFISPRAIPLSLYLAGFARPCKLVRARASRVACSFIRSQRRTQSRRAPIPGVANIGVRRSRGCNGPRERVRGRSGIRAKLSAKSARNCKQHPLLFAAHHPRRIISRIPRAREFFGMRSLRSLSLSTTRVFSAGQRCDASSFEIVTAVE